MKVRLVAYRTATSTATAESTYELDLQEEPNISLNFQFADIREPEKRKASYSQTFKLPFTDNNNEFFQNWYNVNLDTLVYSTKKKFDAILYVGTVPQFEGFLQLKSVYLNKGLYEVVLMSTSADLFTNIGTKKLQDCIGDELDHTFSDFNIKASWDGSTDGFFNVDSTPVSLRDDTVNVQKVMYPLSFTRPNSFYDTTNNYLGMSNVSANDDPNNKKVDITQLKPAIQLKELFKKIIAQAGFSYTSNFINGSYFGKLFMTTANHTGMPNPVERQSAFALDGQMMVGNDVEWGTYTVDASDNSVQYDTPWTIIQANTDTAITGFTMPSDPGNAWDTTNMTLTKVSSNLNQVKVRFVMKTQNIWPANASISEGALDENQDFPVTVEIRKTTGDVDDPDNLVNAQTIYGEVFGAGSAGIRYRNLEFNMDLNNLDEGESCYFRVQHRLYRRYQLSGGAGTIVIGGSQCWLTNPSTSCTTSLFVFNGAFNEISAQWTGYGGNIYDNIIDVDQCIDPEITQKDFIKDIIQRFNLVVVADSDDATKLIIEPYNDFAASGDLLHWSDKLDTSKELVIKDTSSLQKQQIIYKDKEDVDLLNKSISESTPSLNPYGIFRQTTTFNEFAKGNLENFSIFAPYINEKIFTSVDVDEDTVLTNVATQYEWTYKETDTGTENVLEPTKPKLFFYNGSPTTIKSYGVDTNIYLHKTDPGTGVITAIAFPTYPLCSPYDLTPNADGTSTILASTRSLYFNQNGPVCGQLQVFNWTALNNNPNGLFNKYWYPYLNDIYGQEARILECHINLNETDIFNFSFADEIFLKDAYYRVLDISNYQVGVNASTKVTLLKSNQKYNGSCFACDSVVADINGSNTVFGYYIFAPTSNPTQAFTFPDSIYVSPECCECVGGETQFQFTFLQSQNLYPCLANSNSLPARLQNTLDNRKLFSSGTGRSIYSGKVFGKNQPLMIGTNTGKLSRSIMPKQGDDIVIKYKNYSLRQPQIDGESHRIVLIGYTTGNTKGYAYTQGDSTKKQIQIPINSNVLIRVKGTATVIGGTSSTFTLGTLEGFAYYTAFIDKAAIVTQLGTAGGVPEFSLKEGTNPQTCTLSILNEGRSIEFGLQDSQTDTQRVWQLTVDIDINNVYNIERSYSETYALFQNSVQIDLQNGEYLLWN